MVEKTQNKSKLPRFEPKKIFKLNYYGSISKVVCEIRKVFRFVQKSGIGQLPRTT
jgi:hypothetical protein